MAARSGLGAVGVTTTVGASTGDRQGVATGMPASVMACWSCTRAVCGVAVVWGVVGIVVEMARALVLGGCGGR
eukprot:7938964-Alexandrium_andersonii.AAC.1